MVVQNKDKANLALVDDLRKQKEKLSFILAKLTIKLNTLNVSAARYV